jgi:catechol 2,3-dioxygenase-like lactoylglutathione lyase family enzyme
MAVDVHQRRSACVNEVAKVNRIEAIVETALYVDDLERAETFYRVVLGFQVLGEEQGRHVFFFQVGNGVLLLFNPENSLKGERLPSHGAPGPGHVAFGIGAEELGAWREHLCALGIPIEQEVTWPRGGRSIYIRDPAGNLVELITPGIWGLPSGW